MKRALVLVYGVVAYVAFLGVFVSLADFLANAGFVRGIDATTTATTATTTATATASPAAIAIDLALVALFGASHSVMARPWFKARWTRIVPIAAERSTYVLVASAILALMVAAWRPIPSVLWSVSAPAGRATIWAIYGAGIALTVASTFLTDHFDLFGLRHVWLFARGRPYTPAAFRERGLYRYVRHPMMGGILVWIWATPSMSAGHALFAAAMSAYVAIGVRFEERDLARALGDPYRAYRRRVHAILPFRPFRR